MPENTESTGKRLAITIPLANEEQTSRSFLGAVMEHLSPEDAVFCVLDKVCRDRTRDIVLDIASAEPRVRLVWAPENRCVVDAYFRGYREAHGAGFDYILEMDGGGSHRPSEIPRFRSAMAAGFDFAAGSRFSPGGSHQGSAYRYLVSRAGTLLVNALLGTRMRDMTSGFECFTRRAMAHVLSKGVISRAHFFQTEIRVMLSDWKWTEVPITYTNPSKGLGTAPIVEALAVLRQMRRERRQGSRRPTVP